MRIDDENKVVWCDNANDLAFVDNKTTLVLVEQLINFDGSYSLCELQDNYFESYNDKKIELLHAILSGYEFKIDEERYYWRKKKEYLAEFEMQWSGVIRIYLNLHKGKKELCMTSRNETSSYKTMFTESEVRELLKQDFDKFEKVEIDE